jgi:hypothetical protein
MRFNCQHLTFSMYVQLLGLLANFVLEPCESNRHDLAAILAQAPACEILFVPQA